MKNLIYILLSIIILFSCNEHNVCLNYVKADSYFKLGLRVDSVYSKNNCIYYTNILSCVENNEFTFKGKMYVKDSIFYYKILNPETEYFPLFDLTKKKKYTINIKPTNSTEVPFNKKLIVILKQQINNKGKDVYIFSVKKITCYQGVFYDGIYFLTLENGIIGSYLYTNNNGINFYAYPEGDILKNKIDYSKFKKFKLL